MLYIVTKIEYGNYEMTAYIVFVTDDKTKVLERYPDIEKDIEEPQEPEYHLFEVPMNEEVLVSVANYYE